MWGFLKKLPLVNRIFNHNSATRQLYAELFYRVWAQGFMSGFIGKEAKPEWDAMSKFLGINRPMDEALTKLKKGG